MTDGLETQKLKMEEPATTLECRDVPLKIEEPTDDLLNTTDSVHRAQRSRWRTEYGLNRVRE